MPRNLRPLEVFPITTRLLEVIRAEDVTPGMRRVTLGGAGLKAHTAPNGRPVGAFRSDGFDDEFKIFLRHPDAAEAVGPVQADGVLNWPREDPHLLFRTYTVRRWDPERGELDIDFVNHGVGPATSWANRVQPGERVQIAGPKMSMRHPEGADWVLVAGDETALPAIGRWLEEWPHGVRAHVFIEVAEEAHRQDLPQPDGVEITWISRDGAAPGTTTLLFDAIRSLEWPPGRAFAWVAGETLTLTPIRRWLRGERGLASDQVEVTGYWRRHEVAVSAEDETMPDLDASEDDAARLHETAELGPAFALRIAVTIGLPVAFDRRDRTTAELAEATGADADGLARLLRYLSAIGVTEALDDGRHRLTDFGRMLEDDRVAEELDLTGPVAHRELGGMLALLAAVRTGTGDYARWFGAGYTEHERSDPARLARREERESERAVYVAGAVAEAVPAGEGTRVAVHGQAAGSLAEAVVRRHPGARAEVVGDVEVLREPVDVLLLSEALRSLTDADAVHLLRRARERMAPGGRMLLFTRPLDPELADDHDYEDDLIEFALHGGGVHTEEEHRALFAAAGLPAPSRTTIGWGHGLYEVALG